MELRNALGCVPCMPHAQCVCARLVEAAAGWGRKPWNYPHQLIVYRFADFNVLFHEKGERREATLSAPLLLAWSRMYLIRRCGRLLKQYTG